MLSKPLGHFAGSKAHVRLDFEVWNHSTGHVVVQSLGTDGQNVRQFLCGQKAIASGQALKYIVGLTDNGYWMSGGG
jgi:hypothetical protein